MGTGGRWGQQLLPLDFSVQTGVELEQQSSVLSTNKFSLPVLSLSKRMSPEECRSGGVSTHQPSGRSDCPGKALPCGL